MFENVTLFGRGGKAAQKATAAKDDGEAEGQADEETAETEEQIANNKESASDEGGDTAQDIDEEEEETKTEGEEDEDEMSVAVAAEGRLGSALAALPKDQRAAARTIARLAAEAATARVAAIVRSQEASGREEAALTLALEGETSAKAAIAVLGKLGRARKKGGLAEAMEGAAQPNLGAGGTSGGSRTAGLSAAVDEINARNRPG